MNMKNGGPAFPGKWQIVNMQRSDAVTYATGMSLRDWFAGQAMKTIIEYEGMDLDATIARQSYELADAMLKERGDI